MKATREIEQSVALREFIFEPDYDLMLTLWVGAREGKTRCDLIVVLLDSLPCHALIDLVNVIDCQHGAYPL